jgi:glycosyltransferase involved in cell wall biosynthesis
MVSPQYPPTVGGIERHVQELTEKLVALGHHVEVITTDPTGALPPIDTYNGVRVRRFPTLLGDSPYIVSLPLGQWLMAHAEQFDIIHGHSYHTPVALQSAIASRMKGVPFVFTPHYHGTGHTPLSKLLHIPYLLPGMWKMHQAHRIICVSAAERSLIVRHFGKEAKCVVIPNGVNLQRIMAFPFQQANPGEIVVLTVGRMQTYKQFDKVIRAAAHLPDTYKIVMVGDGFALESLKQLVHSLNLQSRVCILGKLGDEELVRWLRTAHVLVTMSRHESFGITLLEGCAGGAVVVASDIPSHREVAQYVPENRVIFTEVDEHEVHLARYIQKAYTSGRVEQTSNWCFPTWQHMAERVEEQYTTLLSSASR